MTHRDLQPVGSILLKPDFSICGMCPSASDILGWQLDDVLDQHIHDILCAKSRSSQHTSSHCPICQQVDQQQFQEATWRGADGLNRHVEFRTVSLGPVGLDADYLVSFLDTSAEQHSRHELSKLQQFSELSPTPMLELDEQGILLFANPVMTELMGQYGFNDEGNACILPEDLSQRVSDVLHSGRAQHHIEVLLDDACYLWALHPFANADEKSVLCVAIDFSDHKRLQYIEQQKQQELNRARREYVAKMTHELRSPLNSVVGYATTLRRRYAEQLDDKGLKMIEMIIRGGNRLASQISDSLDTSKIESAQVTANMSQISISILLQEVEEQMRPLAENKHLLYGHGDQPDTVELMTDRQKLKQILVNLLDNAIKYTHKGSIWLTVHEGIDGELGTVLKFVVCDTGQGIPKGSQQEIFTSYSRLARDKASAIVGTGLGLSVVNEFVQLLGGRMDLQSAEGHGSTFSVILPYNNDT